ncbi:hypothetical protein SFRURICE_016450 [Spodoptera frugiperda]|nr:hypothetical protein SFRURICE_016450 [Spodoptera frugiperda]
MSNKTYNDLLVETSELIGEATQADEALYEAGPADRNTLLPILLELRVRYTMLLSRLDTVYDQLLQPQKRMIVRRLLESCLGRLIEIKHDLVEMRLTDHTFDDDEALVKLQVTPNQAEPCIPQFFIRERAEEIESRRQFVLDTLRKLGYEPPKPQPLVLTEQQAVIIIQSHERARQGRLRDTERECPAQHLPATAFRKFGCGIQGVIMIELGRFPEDAFRESGAAETMYSRLVILKLVWIVNKQESSPVSSKESKRSKESKDKKNGKGDENGKNGKEDADDLDTYKCASSAFLKDMTGANEEYEDIWKFKEDADNPHERYYKDMIEREKMVKIEQEIRNIVDELMRSELELLQAAYDRDRAQKGKKSKKQQKKARRGGKKSKKKKEKDLTPDRTTESLFEELVSNGIIRPYPLVKINDYIGEKCFVGASYRESGVEATPCLGDVRQLVKEYCILPLGSELVRNNAPLVRSVLITGICPEDRVIFIGTSRAPWDAEQKLLFQCYQKIIQIPRADYGSISMMWRTKLHRAGALNPRLDISCLSRISDSYTLGTLLEALDAVLTTKRRLQLRVRVLTAAEIAVQLSTREPVYAEHEAAADSWWYKTPMEKRRQKVLQRLEEAQAEAENGG